MHQSEIRHFSKMNTRVHLRQMLTLGALTCSRNLAHEVQNAHLLPWKTTTVPNENGWVCWCCYDEVDGKDNLGFLAFRSRAWKASFRRRGLFQLWSIQPSTTWECSTESEDPTEVDVIRVGALGAGFTASSAEKAWLSSIRSSSRWG